MLRPRKKITRKEMKEDPLVTYYVRVQKFMQNYSKQVNIGLIAIVAIVVIGIFVIRSKKKADIIANGKLGIAEQYYAAMNYTRAIDELKAIIMTYSGTYAAGRATFYLANVYFEQNDFDNAEKYYQMYLDDYGTNRLLSASSMAGNAACLESRNQYDDAAVIYEKAGKKYSDLSQAPYYLKDASRCYLLAGDNESGKSVLEYIQETYPKSPIIQKINSIYNSL
jgi:TolA-binding protein